MLNYEVALVCLVNGRFFFEKVNTIIIIHGKLMDLSLYLSRIPWERGYHDDAFASLDESLKHAKSFEQRLDDNEMFLR